MDDAVDGPPDTGVTNVLSSEGAEGPEKQSIEQIIVCICSQDDYKRRWKVKVTRCG